MVKISENSSISLLSTKYWAQQVPQIIKGSITKMTKVIIGQKLYTIFTKEVYITPLSTVFGTKNPLMFKLGHLTPLSIIYRTNYPLERY